VLGPRLYLGGGGQPAIMVYMRVQGILSGCAWLQHHMKVRQPCSKAHVELHGMESTAAGCSGCVVVPGVSPSW